MLPAAQEADEALFLLVWWKAFRRDASAIAEWVDESRPCVFACFCVYVLLFGCVCVCVCLCVSMCVPLCLCVCVCFYMLKGTHTYKESLTTSPPSPPPARSARLRKKNFACAPSRPPSSTANGARLCLPRGSSQLVQHSTVRGSTWYGSVWYIVARYDTVRHYTVRYGDIWITKDNVIEKFIRPFELSKDCIKIKVPSVMMRIGE